MSNVINVTYQSNYNGCTIEDVPEDDKHAQVCDQVTTTLIDVCDEDGYCFGSEDYITEVIVTKVKEVYGDDVEVIVNIDQYST